MAGFFKKLLGKKDKEETPGDDGGSWAEHEISLEVQENLDEEIITENPLEAKDLTETSTETLVSTKTPTPKTNIEATTELPVIQSAATPPFTDTIEIEVTPPGPAKTLDNYSDPAELSLQKSEIAPEPTADFKMPKSQVEADVVHKAAAAPPKQKPNVAAPDIATIKNSDLMFAMDQTEVVQEMDPLDEITAQIQKELAAEKTVKQKKETLDKLIEITSQLKKPDFDEDIDV